MVFAINSAWSLLSAKSWTPLCVVNESTMISGWFSGQPVAKAVTKSAEVDRFVIEISFGKIGSAVVNLTPAAEQFARGASDAALGAQPGTKAVTSISTFAR